MFDIDASLPAEVIPLSWLLGVWEGTGVIAYKVGDTLRENEFRQRIAFTNDGGPHVKYACSAWLADADGADLGVKPLFSELGYWRLSRPLGTRQPRAGHAAGRRRRGVHDGRCRRDAAERRGRFRHRGLDPAAVGGEASLPRNRRQCAHRSRHRRCHALGHREGVRRRHPVVRPGRRSPAVGVGHRGPRPRPAHPRFGTAGSSSTSPSPRSPGPSATRRSTTATR